MLNLPSNMGPQIVIGQWTVCIGGTLVLEKLGSVAKVRRIIFNKMGNTSNTFRTLCLYYYDIFWTLN